MQHKNHLDTKDLIDIFLKINDTINFYWNFYVVSVSGLAFWQLTSTEPFELRTKIVITIGFAIFIIMNGFGLYKHYYFFEAIRGELAPRVEGMELQNTKLKKAFKHKAFFHPAIKVLGVHILVDVPLIILIWSCT